MPWDLGDSVPLTIQIRDSDGNLANATDVSVAVTLPDGSTHNSGSILPVSVGQYEYDYATLQAGRHNVRWVATGTNASAYTDSFVVDPADDGDFISLQDAKTFLRLDLTQTTYDELLRVYISSACEMITDRMGPVSPKTVSETKSVFQAQFMLQQYPVIAVISVEMLPGPVAVDQADLDAGNSGWYLADARTGRLRHTRQFCGQLRVTYRVGRSPLPSNFRLAALELVAHQWRMSQMNSAGGRPAVNFDSQTVPGTSFALPYTVRQLLGLDKRSQSRVFS
jgi:hypothetical protein